MTTPTDTDEDKSWGQQAYELFMGDFPHDWTNAPDQHRWIRVGQGMARAAREANQFDAQDTGVAQRQRQPSRGSGVSGGSTPFPGSCASTQSFSPAQCSSGAMRIGPFPDSAAKRLVSAGHITTGESHPPRKQVNAAGRTA